MAIATLIHVNEVNDDDSAQVAQPDLANDLLDGIHVRFNNRIFKLLRLAHVLAGIYVNCHQRFGLVNHDVTTGFQPDLGLERLVDFFLDVEFFKQRRLFGVELYALH